MPVKIMSCNIKEYKIEFKETMYGWFCCRIIDDDVN